MKKYNPKTNRLNEVHESLPLAARQFDRMINSEHIPLAARQFDRMINSVASWANGYTVKMEIDLTKDLLRLKDKWESKSLGK
jgi:hypothetical protein